MLSYFTIRVLFWSTCTLNLFQNLHIQSPNVMFWFKSKWPLTILCCSKKKLNSYLSSVNAKCCSCDQWWALLTTGQLPQQLRPSLEVNSKTETSYSFPPALWPLFDICQSHLTPLKVERALMLLRGWFTPVNVQQGSAKAIYVRVAGCCALLAVRLELCEEKSKRLELNLLLKMLWSVCCQ